MNNKKSALGITIAVGTILAVVALVINITLIFYQQSILNSIIEFRAEQRQEIIEVKEEVNEIKERVFVLPAHNNPWTSKGFNAITKATWRIETGNGTSILRNDYNNAGGIKCGAEYCVYPTKEQGYIELEMLVMRYYLKYGTDFKSWREEYCGLHCGEQDLNTFIEIYNEEMEKL